MKRTYFEHRIALLLSFLTITVCLDGQSHFTKVWSGNGVDHMNINLVTAQINGTDLVAGDEIGIFDGTKCVGVGILTAPLSMSNILPVTVSRDDGSGNGYTVGNEIVYRFYDRSAGIEVTPVATVYYTNNPSWSSNGKFNIGATAFVDLDATVINNHAPVANAGSDQNVNEGTLVTLEGSGSSDPDGDTLTYLWTAPEGIELSSNILIRPTFTAPQVNTDTSYIFTLVVNDGTVNSSADQVVITVLNVEQSKHFIKVWNGNGVDHMNINIVSAQINNIDLVAGDEIGIFDETKCVGVGILTAPLSTNNILPVAVSRDDGSGNGYIAGNNIVYRFYDQSAGIEVSPVTTVYYTNNPSWSSNGKFNIGATAFVDLNATISTVYETLSVINETVISGNNMCFNALQTITVAGGGTTVDLETGSTVDLIAGQSILFLPGFHSHNGSQMNAWITTDGTFCEGGPAPIVAQPESKSSYYDEVPENSVGTQKLVKVFPNPNNGTFTLELTNFENAIVSVYSISGAKLLQVAVNAPSMLPINLPNLVNGIYFLKVNDSDKEYVTKFIVNGR